jgi:acyl carrier protein
MRTKEEINQLVVSVIAEQLQLTPDVILPDTDIVSALGADSLDCVEIVMFLEDKLLIEINDEEIEPLTKVRQIVEYLWSKAEVREGTNTGSFIDVKVRFC